MKLSVSLPENDLEFLDAYARKYGYASRSAAVHEAIATLRLSQLADGYEDAWQTWAESDEAGLWETVSADGLGF